MPWLILLILLIAIGQSGVLTSVDWVGLPSGWLIGLLFGLATGWAIWFSAGWNAHVERQRDQAIDRAEQTAKAERRKSIF